MTQKKFIANSDDERERQQKKNKNKRRIESGHSKRDRGLVFNVPTKRPHEAKKNMEKDESNTHRHLDGQVDFGGLDREIKKNGGNRRGERVGRRGRW